MIAPEEKIAEARTTYGRTIQEILAKEPERGIYKVLGAIEVLVGSKIYQKLPTSLASGLAKNGARCCSKPSSPASMKGPTRTPSAKNQARSN